MEIAYVANINDTEYFQWKTPDHGNRFVKSFYEYIPRNLRLGVLEDQDIRSSIFGVFFSLFTSFCSKSSMQLPSKFENSFGSMTRCLFF